MARSTPRPSRRRVAAPVGRRRSAPRPAVRDRPARPAIGAPSDATIDVQALFDSAGVATTVVEYRRAEVIFRQGDPCERVFYIRQGGVKISVLSKRGREAVVAILRPGDFFGEGGLAGQPVRMGTATATTLTAILSVDQQVMARLLHGQHALADRFIAHLLSRTIRVEEDLVDQLFSSGEKRLARKLLLLARYGERDEGVPTLPPISQETLAAMVGTTRSRVNHFMQKFQRLGMIDHREGIRIHRSLLTVVLHE